MSFQDSYTEHLLYSVTTKNLLSRCSFNQIWRFPMSTPGLIPNLARIIGIMIFIFVAG